MTPIELVENVRNHYVDQFASMAKEVLAAPNSVIELKLDISDDSKLFQNLYCIDSASRVADDNRFADFAMKRELRFDPVTLSFGGTTVTIQQMSWNDVIIRHDLESVPMDKLAVWFDYWFDPDDTRAVDDEQLSNIVHSMVISPGSISIDFGTSETDSFWGMLKLLSDAGSENIFVSASAEEH